MIFILRKCGMANCLFSLLTVILNGVKDLGLLSDFFWSRLLVESLQFCCTKLEMNEKQKQKNTQKCVFFVNFLKNCKLFNFVKNFKTSISKFLIFSNHLT